MPSFQVGKLRAEGQPIGTLVQNQVLCSASGSPPANQGLSRPDSASARRGEAGAQHQFPRTMGCDFLPGKELPETLGAPQERSWTHVRPLPSLALYCHSMGIQV